MTMLLVFFLINCLCAQETPVRVTPEFTCWFANYTKISETQFERNLYLVFGYTSNTNINLTFGLTPNNPDGRRNRLSPATLPQTQVTRIFPGVHLFAFETRVPININITWFLANNSAVVSPDDLVNTTMCRVKFNLTCPGPGIHNDSTRIRGFCSTVATRFCGRRYLCDLGKCVDIRPDVCPVGFNCINNDLACQLAPTPQPTVSIPPTSAPTIPLLPTPPIAVTSSPTRTPTFAPTPAPTLAPIIPAPTTKAPTKSPTKAPTRRPTPLPTGAPTPESTGLSTPSTLNILTRVGTIVALAVAMILVVLFTMATRNTQRRR